jgi:hypothetical protein
MHPKTYLEITMKKSVLALSAVLCLSASAVFAGPKSFTPGESGTTADGREFDKKLVNCSGKSEGIEITMFKDIKKWCLNDESYCNRDIIKVAKKACKA